MDADALEPDTHLDLCTTRSGYAKLEECVAAYDATPAETHWRGGPLDSGRFGEELGPTYLAALAAGDEAAAAELRSVIDHYLRTDLEANLLVYYGDIGVPFDPALEGEQRTF
jgi:hypothetical protein